MVEKIEIIIRDPRDGPGGRGRKSKKDVGSRRRNVQALPRRLRQQDGLINFYDLGQKWNGSAWVDIPFSVTPTINGIGSGFVDVEPFTLANWDTLRTLIFLEDPSTWKTAYRKLEYEPAEKYGLDMVTSPDEPGEVIYPVARDGSRLDSALNLVAGTKWEAGGLNPGVPVVDAIFKSIGAFSLLQEDEVASHEVKVTNGPTYASPSVSFNILSAESHVFLMPWIANSYGISFDGVNNDSYLFRAFKPLPRSIWLDALYEGPEPYPVFSLQIGPTYTPAFTAQVLADAKVGGRALEFDGVTFTEISPTLFPLSPDATILIDQNVGLAPVVQNQPGSLLGAIEQSGQMFYFWAESTFSTSFENTRALPL